MYIRIILELFEKYKCPGIAFFLQSSRCISNEQWCLKTTGLRDDLLLLSSFTFSISYSVLPLHTVYDFQYLFLLLFFFKLFIKYSGKTFVYIYSMYNIYIRKFMNFCLTKKFMTFWFHLFDLCMNRMLDF